MGGRTASSESQLSLWWPLRTQARAVRVVDGSLPRGGPTGASRRTGPFGWHARVQPAHHPAGSTLPSRPGPRTNNRDNFSQRVTVPALVQELNPPESPRAKLRTAPPPPRPRNTLIALPYERTTLCVSLHTTLGVVMERLSRHH